VDTAIVALAGVLVAVALLLLFVPVRLLVSAQGRGDPSGAWALAAGGQLGPFVASGVGARGVTPRVELRLFGRKVWSTELGELFAPTPESAESSERRFDHAVEVARARYSRLERWFDPMEVGLWLLDERRRLRVDRMVVELRYSFQDVALTGKIMAAVYVLSGLLPPQLELRQEVSWESVDRASAALDGRIKLRPGLILVDSALFVLRRVKLRKRPRPLHGERQTT
jgi:hypothetical protein